MAQGKSMQSFFLLCGIVVLLALLARGLVRKSPVPDVLVYILLGIALNLANLTFPFMDGTLREGLHIMSEMGIVILLFRVGLESDLGNLISQLKVASVIWIGDVSVSATLGYLTARYVLGFPFLPSLFVAIALSATSVGITAAVWQSAGRLDSREGALLIDVAELDDISAILLMGLLFSLAPSLHSSQAIPLLSIAKMTGILLLKFLAFFVLCALFARYVEGHLTRYFKKESLSGVLIAVIGVTFLIAGFAEWIGFSLAIGAIFAGFAFSNDPAELELDKELDTLFYFFVPFFFVQLGMGLDLKLLGSSLALGGVLFVAACLGKTLGSGLFALPLLRSPRQTLMLSLSMIPRAEIAMLVMLFGYKHHFVPARLFGAMVVVTLFTCLLPPPLLSWLFQKEPPSPATSTSSP